MKIEVTELRKRIDGLSQLVKELRPFETWRVDINKIPDGWDLDQFLRVFREHRTNSSLL